MTPNFKKALTIAWHATMRGCTLAILILFVFFIIMSAITAAEGTTEQGMTFSSLITLTVFSLVVSYAKEIFGVEALSAPIRWSINFLVVGVAYFFVILRSGLIANTSSSFYVTGLVIYVLVYAAVLGISLFVKRLTAKTEDQSDTAEEYTSRFV